MQNTPSHDIFVLHMKKELIVSNLYYVHLYIGQVNVLKVHIYYFEITRDTIDFYSMFNIWITAMRCLLYTVQFILRMKIVILRTDKNWNAKKKL